jgi:plasmid stabilization system protein ParE
LSGGGSIPLRVVLSIDARRQLVVADDWWLENRADTDFTVDSEFEDTLVILSRNPALGMTAAGRPKGQRRWLLRRVSYWIYYRVRENELQIVNVRHASRRAQR